MKWILDIFFPEACIGCGKRGDVLCERCVKSLRSATRETPTGITAAFDYRDPIIKKTIWNLKYHRRSHIGEKLGTLLYETHLEEISDMRLFGNGQLILVVPAPLSRRRKKERGYNQAEKIAAGFCKASGEGIFEFRKNIVVKKVDTKPQAHIANRAERLRNITGVFSITNINDIAGKTIIVIDDVTTTGGTLGEICHLLKKSGARKVYGYAIAH